MEYNGNRAICHRAQGRPGHPLSGRPALNRGNALNWLRWLLETAPFEGQARLAGWPPGMIELHMAANLILSGGFWVTALLLAIYTYRSGTVLYRRKRMRRVAWAFAAFIASTGFIFLLHAVSIAWPVQRLTLLLTIVTAALIWVAQMLLIPAIRDAPQVTPEEAVISLEQRLDHLIEKLTPFADAIRSVDDAGREGDTR